MKLSARTERWLARAPFRIAGATFEHFDVVVVQLGADGAVGAGEGGCIPYLDQTAEGALGQIEAVRPAIEAGVDRESLQRLLPPGAARNAVDAALWDLEAKRSGRRVHALAGVTPREAEIQLSIGIEATPQAMAERAAAAASHRRLKVKLDAEQPLQRMQAIRRARPDAALVVDANQAWTFGQLQALAPALADMGVQMIEQPLPRGADAQLEGWRSPVPLCADESCLHLGELDEAARRYQLINIKLDKTGGLTAALALARAARLRGLGLMVGCMGGTSLAMAPAFVLACECDVVDLDAPLWLRSDRLPAIAYADGHVPVFDAAVWG